jgi:acyl transferase domain-containing protein
LSGLIKAVLSMEKGIIPGNLHFHVPNPQIDFDGLNVSVVGKNTPWPDCQIKVCSLFGEGETLLMLNVSVLV